MPTGDMNRYVCLNPKMQGGILGAQATQFNPSKDVAEQNRMGSMGMAWGLNFGVDQGVQQHTIGALGGTPLIRGEHADGATVLKTDGWSNSVTGLLKKGDKLHWDGSEAVNPSSKEPTGGEKFVTVTADVDSNGTGQADIPISPPLKVHRAVSEHRLPAGRQREGVRLGRQRLDAPEQARADGAHLPPRLHHVLHRRPGDPGEPGHEFQGVLGRDPAQRPPRAVLGWHQ